MKDTSGNTITELGLELSQKCNLACSYCYLGDRNSSYLDMTEDIADRAIELLFKNTNNTSQVAINFWGGEPLLNFKLLKYVTSKSKILAEERGIKINFLVITNGTIINNEMISFFDKENINLQISLDGDETIHDFYRKSKSGEGSYKKVLAAIRKIDQYNCSGNNCIYSIKSTITRQALPLDKILEHFNEQNFYYTLSPATSAPLFDELGIIEPQEMEAQAKILFQDWETQFDKGLNIKNNLVMKFFKTIILNETQKYACNAGISYFGVGADGKIYPCHRLFNNADYIVGDVWKGINFNLTNSLFNHTIEQRDLCGRCSILYMCGSTCPVESLMKGGLDNVDPVYCAFNKTIIKECISFLIKLNRTKPNNYQELIKMLKPNNIIEFPFKEIDSIPVIPQGFQNLIPHKAENAKVVDLDEDGIIYIEGDIDKKYIANVTTMAIWDLIDGSRTIQDIAGIIADLCKVNLEEICDDIYKQVAVFIELRFINV